MTHAIELFHRMWIFRIDTLLPLLPYIGDGVLAATLKFHHVSTSLISPDFGEQAVLRVLASGQEQSLLPRGAVFVRQAFLHATELFSGELLCDNRLS